ncbi:O-antigen ligase family protein [Butyrivibrio sp. AD3002]|uniref:O-antigen ligase family protein n=1 Tax=Butyrivibrio sp. AD3002 TaxID=1280670 RepID=UPI0003B71319|nr:O-antigen ligase family protein [Butyrivibrio sp. AD3002]
MFLFIFSTLLFLANIYFFYKKKYMNLFFPCLLFLPKYYGFDISNAFPVISATRLMFIVFYIYTLVNKRNGISLQKHSISKFFSNRAIILLSGYFISRVIANMYYIGTYSEAIKTIFSLLFEQLLLLFAIYLLNPSQKEMHSVIKSVVLSASVLFVVGIFESFSFFRPFDSLYTISREMHNDYYVRLGLLRATTTLGLPVLYGNMCILILPLILYLYNTEKKRRYLAIIVLDALATVHSGSRADAIFFVFITIIYLFLKLITKDGFLTSLKNTFIVAFSLASIIFIVSIGNKYTYYFYSGSAKAVLNEFGFDFQINENAPEGVSGYGDNKHGVTSRTFQFTGIEYAFGKNPVFGLGSGALQNGDVYYNGWGTWVPYHTYDMGIVEVLISEGILGFIAHMFLFMSIIYIYFKRRKVLSKNNFTLLALLPLSYLLSTLSTANMYAFLFFDIILCLRLTSDNSTETINME